MLSSSSSSMAVVAVATAMLLRPVAADAVDYEPVKLAWMILYADAIALVERKQPRAASYRVTPVLQLKGEVLPDSMLISESSSWRSSDFKNYSKRVLVFLQHGSAGKQWRLMGPNGEGYAPVDHGFVYLPGMAVSHQELHTHHVAGEKIVSLRLPIDALLELIRDVRNCHPSSHRVERNQPSLCSSREQQLLAEKSDLHAAVLNDIAGMSDTGK